MNDKGLLEREKTSLAFLEAMLTPADVVLEGGGGSGLTGNLIQTRSRHMATFEPLPDVARAIRAEYPGLSVIAAALWLFTGRALINRNGDYWNSSLVGHPRTGGHDHQEKVETIDILDAVRLWEPTALVLDIEGAEGEVLFRLMEAPVWVDKIIAEVHPGLMGAGKHKAMLEALARGGFILQRQEKDSSPGDYVACWVKGQA